MLSHIILAVESGLIVLISFLDTSGAFDIKKLEETFGLITTQKMGGILLIKSLSCSEGW